MSEFTLYRQETTTGETKDLLAGIERGYGFVPNLFAYMAEAPTTIKAYLELSQLISKGTLSAAQQQVVMLAVSVENCCVFCIAAHRAIGKMNHANQQTLDALNSGTTIIDDSDRALVSYVRMVVKQRGFMAKEDMQSFIDAGFTQAQILEVVLIVSFKTLSNYINHITQPKVNEELLNML